MVEVSVAPRLEIDAMVSFRCAKRDTFHPQKSRPASRTPDSRRGLIDFPQDLRPLHCAISAEKRLCGQLSQQTRRRKIAAFRDRQCGALSGKVHKSGTAPLQSKERETHQHHQEEEGGDGSLPGGATHTLDAYMSFQRGLQIGGAG